MFGFTRSVKVSRKFRTPVPLTASFHAPPRPDVAALQQRLSNETILAPLTRGGSLPFRRLAVAHGATATMGEMIFARTLIKRTRATAERARLRRSPDEPFFGVQIATNAIAEGRAAIAEAHAAGADWVDLNCGCPIHEATRRGLGSALLRKPAKLARLVEGLAESSPLPLTVKIRLSAEGDSSVNVLEQVERLRDAGAALVTLHGRTARARYSKPADWALIEQSAQVASPMPLIGNGDILTHYEARTRRAAAPTTHALMVGRGALIKPWLFEEVKTGCEWAPTAEERVGVYRNLAANFIEHFGSDARGRKSAWYFLPWHFDFFCRYRHLPECTFGALAAEAPLQQSSRLVDEVLEKVEGPRAGLPPLERLLRCEHKGAHEAIASTLWESTSDADACAALQRVANEGLAMWELELANGMHDRNSRDANEGRG